MTGRDENQARALFQERDRNAPSLLTRQIEQRVIGGDWGANGFTTMGQAGTLARELHLSAADRLLDVGPGRGWPGLYLAARTGCRVVLSSWTIYLPGAAANALTQAAQANQDFLPPWQGGLVLAAYGLLLATAGTVLTIRRGVT